MVWGCGGTILSHADRARFDTFVRAVLSGMLSDYQANADAERYDYDMPGLDQGPSDPEELGQGGVEPAAVKNLASLVKLTPASLFPPKGAGTVYDYFYDVGSGEWKLWEGLLQDNCLEAS